MEEDLVSHVKMGPEEQRAHHHTMGILEKGDATKLALAAIPTVVSLRDVVADPPSSEEPLSSLVVANRGHHALYRALEDLEKLEVDSELGLEQHLIASITQLVTDDDASFAADASSEEALRSLEHLGASIPRRVCQHPFRRNDIVWVCRTCQSDETCVLCHACYSKSNHDGHDVAFYHAQAGGCCDCGDPDAWDPAGFCPRHGPSSEAKEDMPQDVVQRVRGIVPACAEWLVQRVALNAQTAHQRTHVQRTMSRASSMPLAHDSAPSSPGAAASFPARQHSIDIDDRRQMSFESLNSNLSDSDEADEGNDVESMLLDHGHVFSPAAASTSKSRHAAGALSSEDSINSSQQTPTLAQKLGNAGRDGHGLYLVLHSDDIHTTSELVEALRELLGSSSYYTDSLLQRLVRALRHHGQLVVWGTMELLAECSLNLVNLWLDGDAVASGRLGAVMLDRASRLVKHGLVCSICTREELGLEQRAVAVLQWLMALARSCDPLCQTVAESLQSDAHLVPMLRADFKLSARITKAWHSLLLTLLAVPIFKSRLAAAYCDTYRHVTAEYARGMGVSERSGYTLSVQFLNRVTYVVGLVKGRDLLGKLGKSLLETLSVASIRLRGSSSTKVLPRLDPNHFVLTHRRYSPCISDLKCVLNVKGMARLFASTGGTFLEDWIQSLSLAQQMDAQVWRSYTQGHVEVEPRGWVGAFNASISLGSLFERLLSWDDDDKTPLDDASSPLAHNLLSCVDLSFYVLTNGLASWQNAEMLSYQPTPNTSMLEPHRRCPASLPFSTIAARHGSTLAMRAVPLSQVTSWSFHLPLHRFAAACLREVCRRPCETLPQLMGMLESDQVSEKDRDMLFRGLMEFPVLVLSRSAQVRAGLWRRNGPGMHDQVLNYAEPPFCRALRDADLLLLQFAVLGRKLYQGAGNSEESDVGCSFLVNLLLHRFGLFDFVGFGKAPNYNFSRYNKEVTAGMYPSEQRSEPDAESDLQELVLPWTYTPAKDVAFSLSLLEDFLHMLIILITELPPVPPRDKFDHTMQAKRRLRREVVHRLASGPKTHSELAEVHHVLSHWDNVFLSEEGKKLNPDDATGAALETALSEVAERKSSRGRLEPDKWELNRSAWEDYDPSFFHISLRSHQTAAENRPISPAAGSSPPFGFEPKPYAPMMSSEVHSSFQRLRRDITADASVLAIAYRTLHVHCRNGGGDDGQSQRDTTDLRGKSAYDRDAMSETALARAVHILTLGAFAWQDANAGSSPYWRNHGGGSVGSIFHNVTNEAPSPTARDWVAASLLSNPDDLMDDDWYEGEEKALILLRRLAVDGGGSGGFVAQDRALRAGAAWLCDFAVTHHSDAAALIGDTGTCENSEPSEKKETDMERRKREAKARAMEKMKNQIARFAEMMQIDAEGDSDNDIEADEKRPQEEASTPTRGGEATQQIRSMSPSSAHGSEFSLPSTASSRTRSPARSESSITPENRSQVHYDDGQIPERLLKHRPHCIICNDSGTGNRRDLDNSMRTEEGEGHRKRSRRKNDGSNALGFVCYAQASVVLKGGGGPPPTSDASSPLSVVRRFVGTHVTLCGHAIHSECCESYLASVSQREDRLFGRREEFRCPLCKRLSNCLVPFIDVGVDWADSPKCLSVAQYGPSMSEANLKSCDDDDMNIDEIGDADTGEPRQVSLHDFLSNTPWWVSRNDDSVLWDGQCAFVSCQESSTSGDTSSQNDDMSSCTPPQRISRRRSVRSLRKRDLYAAWNAMMRTPRFIRRRQRRKDNDAQDVVSTAIDGRAAASVQWPVPDESSSGETVVWRRFMDLVSDVAYRADGKRLGEEHLHANFGEFRHYQVEKYSYNVANRIAGRETVDWPACLSQTTFPDSRRQELSREKLLTKLLMSIQSFTYSCCCEASESRHLLQKNSAVAGVDGNSTRVLHSTYGIRGVCCEGQLVLLPEPSPVKDEGTQPFDGRLGKLRYLGLAVMAAAGAVSADLVQLVLAFPVSTVAETADSSSMDDDQPLRAPITYPILFGHVLTHVVAAMCAACGRARARSDSLDFVWPVPFSRAGSFYGSVADSSDADTVDAVIKDCEGFMKLGLLARILQVMLGHLELGPGNERFASISTDGPYVIKILSRALKDMKSNSDMSQLEYDWLCTCFSLLEIVLSNQADSSAGFGPEVVPRDRPWLEKFYKEACSMAAVAASSYLAEAGTIVQVLVPGAVSRYGIQEVGSHESTNTSGIENLESLRTHFGFEPVDVMLKSSLVREVILSWYTAALHHDENAEKPDQVLVRGASLQSRLMKTEGFRALDWPMESTKVHIRSPPPREHAYPLDADVSPMQVDTDSGKMSAPENVTAPAKAGASPACSSKKSVPLLGGYCDEGNGPPTRSARPRISMLPTSYTDLYAELCALAPDSEQIGLCLVCGEVLNAGGKGECTKHSLKCGAGSGIFFLLQECVGLIMHGGKAAYVHSPYVDSHGETPQYRGRPLNMDFDRYDILHDYWSGHKVREKVIAERGSSRQVIIAEFY